MVYKLMYVHVCVCVVYMCVWYICVSVCGKCVCKYVKKASEGAERSSAMCDLQEMFP